MFPSENEGGVKAGTPQAKHLEKAMPGLNVCSERRKGAPFGWRGAYTSPAGGQEQLLLSRTLVGRFLIFTITYKKELRYQKDFR